MGKWGNAPSPSEVPRFLGAPKLTTPEPPQSIEALTEETLLELRKDFSAPLDFTGMDSVFAEMKSASPERLAVQCECDAQLLSIIIVGVGVSWNFACRQQ